MNNYKTPKDPNSNRSLKNKHFKEVGIEGIRKENFYRKCISVGLTEDQAELLSTLIKS